MRRAVGGEKSLRIYSKVCGNRQLDKIIMVGGFAVDFAYKRSQHFGPILSHLVKDKFTYSVVDKSMSLACS
jgi:hypothetical protein